MTAEVDELERAAADAYLRGRDAESTDLWSRAFQEHVAGGEHRRAARAAFWLWFGLGNRGELAAAGGWLARGQRILDGLADGDRDCAEQGFYLVPVDLGHVRAGEFEECRRVAREAVAIGDRFGERDLAALIR